MEHLDDGGFFTILAFIFLTVAACTVIWGALNGE